MRLFAMSLAGAALATSLPLSAQVATVQVPGRASSILFGDRSRVAIGITTSSSATARDTLGLLVTSVRAGSPADKAGIVEGDRVASVNGVSLTLSPADIDASEMAGVMTRRLTRELNKLNPGDEVSLGLRSNGQAKSIRIKTAATADLYMSDAQRRAADRITIGLSVGATGNRRDTLGVFVMGVDDDGPAAKAGIQEGSRIASINGVELRGQRSDDDQVFVPGTNVSRLERELQRVKPGDEVELRVYYNGQFKNVKVTTARAGDFPQRRRAITVVGSGDLLPAMPLPDIAGRIGADFGRELLGRLTSRVVW